MFYFFNRRQKNDDSGGIRTHASEKIGALNQRLRPLGHEHVFSATLLKKSAPHNVKIKDDSEKSGNSTGKHKNMIIFVQERK
jgi:hypothetical protein